MSSKTKKTDMKAVMGGSLEDLFSTTEEREQQWTGPAHSSVQANAESMENDKSFVTASEINSVKEKLKVSQKDPREQTTIKMQAYLKPRIMEAFTLHKILKYGYNKVERKNSEVINDALEQFLEKELDALAHLPLELSENDRIQKALNNMR